MDVDCGGREREGEKERGSDKGAKRKEGKRTHVRDTARRQKAIPIPIQPASPSVSPHPRSALPLRHIRGRRSRGRPENRVRMDYTHPYRPCSLSLRFNPRINIMVHQVTGHYAPGHFFVGPSQSHELGSRSDLSHFIRVNNLQELVRNTRLFSLFGEGRGVVRVLTRTSFSTPSTPG